MTLDFLKSGSLIDLSIVFQNHTGSLYFILLVCSQIRNRIFPIQIQHHCRRMFCGQIRNGIGIAFMLQLICFLPRLSGKLVHIPIGKGKCNRQLCLLISRRDCKAPGLIFCRIISLYGDCTQTDWYFCGRCFHHICIFCGQSWNIIFLFPQIPTIHTPCQVKSQHFLIETLCRLFLSRRKAVPNLTATLPCQQGLPFLLRCQLSVHSCQTSTVQNAGTQSCIGCNGSCQRCRKVTTLHLQICHRSFQVAEQSRICIRCDHHIAQMMPISIKDSLKTILRIFCISNNQILFHLCQIQICIQIHILSFICISFIHAPNKCQIIFYRIDLQYQIFLLCCIFRILITPARNDLPIAPAYCKHGSTDQQDYQIFYIFSGLCIHCLISCPICFCIIYCKSFVFNIFCHS